LGKLIAVAGNTGVGKTTLVKTLCEQGGYTCALEKHENTPFHEQFSQDLGKYALANQVDFFLRRADQEIKIRAGTNPGVQDGGLDQDFHVFSKLFHQKGYLDQEEFNTCRRMYTLLRKLLPPPELIIWLKADPHVIAERFVTRARRLNIANTEDISAIDSLLKSWIGSIDRERLITVDSGSEDERYRSTVELVTGLLVD
jgi:deoxyadenosine/deoxycytidine kinase